MVGGRLYKMEIRDAELAKEAGGRLTLLKKLLPNSTLHRAVIIAGDIIRIHPIIKEGFGGKNYQEAFEKYMNELRMLTPDYKLL